MSTWKVDTSHLRDQGMELQNLSSRIAKINANLRSVGNLGDFSFSGKSTLQARVNDLTSAVEEQSRKTRTMGEKLVVIARLYDLAEQDIKEQGAKDIFSSVPQSGLHSSGATNTGSGAEMGGRGGVESSGDGKDDFGWDFLKAVLTFRNKFKKDDGAGVGKDFLSYLKSAFDFLNGEKTGWNGASNLFDFADKSTGMWKGLYEYFKSQDPTGLLEKTWGQGAAGVGIAGSMLALLSKSMTAMGADNSTASKAAANILDVGSGGIDVAKSVYEYTHFQDFIGKEQGPFSPASQWAAFGETVTSSLAQTFRSVEKYGADGWQFMDFAETGVDVAVTGLEKMISCLTFNIISADTFGTTTEEISEGLKEWANNLGKDIGRGLTNLFH